MTSRLATGIPALDAALGGGIPVGLCEIFGDEHDAHVALALLALRRSDGAKFFAPSMLPSDFEKKVAGQCGVVHAGTYEAAVAAVSRAIELLPCCTVAVLSSQIEAEQERAADLGEADMYARYCTVRQLLYDLRNLAIRNDALVILLSESRDAMRGGGRIRSSLETIAAQVCDTRIRCMTKQVSVMYGQTAFKGVECKVIRSLASPPGGTCTAHFLPDVGFSVGLEHLKWMTAQRTACRKGAYWELQTGERLGPGWLTAARQLEALWATK